MTDPKAIDEIAKEQAFSSPDGSILNPENFSHWYFVTILKVSGIRTIQLHDLRHSFGSLLIQNDGSIVYIKEQTRHSSIQSRWTRMPISFLARTSHS